MYLSFSVFSGFLGFFCLASLARHLMMATKRESIASLIHDTSPTLRQSLQQSHNKGLYYGFRDAILDTEMPRWLPPLHYFAGYPPPSAISRAPLPPPPSETGYPPSAISLTPLPPPPFRWLPPSAISQECYNLLYILPTIMYILLYILPALL